MNTKTKTLPACMYHASEAFAIDSLKALPFESILVFLSRGAANCVELRSCWKRACGLFHGSTSALPVRRDATIGECWGMLDDATRQFVIIAWRCDHECEGAYDDSLPCRQSSAIIRTNPYAAVQRR